MLLTAKINRYCSLAALCALAFAIAFPVHATSEFGSYLAGRLARNSNDTINAAKFYGNALVRDPRNAPMMPNWHRIASSAPEFLADLRYSVEVDRR